MQTSFSTAKSVISLQFGPAIAEHKRRSIDPPAENVLPDFRNSGVSLRDLPDMTASFAIHDAGLLRPFDVPWNDYKLMYFALDLREVVEAVQPEYSPGTHFQYDGMKIKI